MNRLCHAALLVLGLGTFAGAAPEMAPAAGQSVQVQITYVDVAKTGLDVRRLLPPASGNDLRSFLTYASRARLTTRTVPGPSLTAPVGQTSTLDRTSTLPAKTVGWVGADFLIGPRLAVHPSLVRPDGAVTVVLGLDDQEIVGPAGYWFPKAEVVFGGVHRAVTLRSGQTRWLSGGYSSPKIERLVFATVTLVPPAKP